MFHPFLPDPYVLSIPVLTTGLTYEVELVPLLDVSNFKTGAIVWRLHAGVSATSPAPNSKAEITLKAYKVWPFDNALNQRFQDDTAIISTATADANSTDGELLTTATPATIGAPAIRIVASIYANAGATTATSVTISAGIVLLD